MLSQHPSRAVALLAATLLAVTLAACGRRGEQERFNPAPSARIDPPDGAYAGTTPRGAVMFVHGGGWTGANPTELRTLREGATPAFRQQGFATMVPEYNAGPRGIADIVHAYDILRTNVGSGVPICGVGVSAGGHLLLELAIRRPALRCVVSLAGPTDLEVTEDGAPALQPLNKIAVAAFGREDLQRYSPALQGSRIKAKVLQIVAANDPLVPPSQAAALERTLPSARTTVLPGAVEGAVFVHSFVPPEAARSAQQEWSSFVVSNLTRSSR